MIRFIGPQIGGKKPSVQILHINSRGESQEKTLLTRNITPKYSSIDDIPSSNKMIEDELKMYVDDQIRKSKEEVLIQIREEFSHVLKKDEELKIYCENQLTSVNDSVKIIENKIYGAIELLFPPNELKIIIEPIKLLPVNSAIIGSFVSHDSSEKGTWTGVISVVDEKICIAVKLSYPITVYPSMLKFELSVVH